MLDVDPEDALELVAAEDQDSVERSTLRSETRSYAGTPFFVSTAGVCTT
jgi:hypothetical protein